MNRANQSGFTLVEVAIAVAVLGVALTTLIGIQTQLVDSYYNERNRTQAALFAQYLMTFVELSEEAPQSKSGELAGFLSDTGYFDDDEATGNEEERIEGWTLDQLVSSADIPHAEDALSRIDLTISWGDAAGESFTMVYFARNADTESSGAASNNASKN